VPQLQHCHSSLPQLFTGSKVPLLQPACKPVLTDTVKPIVPQHGAVTGSPIRQSP
jgi:hypothetical protein